MISLTSPIRTRAHDWPAGAKIGGLCLASTALLLSDAPALHLTAAAMVLVLHAAPGMAFLRAGLRSLRFVLPLALALLVWHGVIGDLARGAIITLRMVTLIALANLVTMTTGLSAMTDLLRRLTRPLRRLGLPVHLLDTAVPLMIRFTPVLVTHAEALAEAWRARSPRRPRWQLLQPLMLAALDDADRVGDAMRARGGPLKTSTRD